MTTQQPMTTKAARKTRSKQDDIKTSLAYRAKRLNLNMQEVQKLTKEPYDPYQTCLLYTSDAADDSLRVDLGGRRII